MSHPEFPAPVRRPAPPLPPLPQYGSRPAPAHPAPPTEWALPAAPRVDDTGHDERYDQRYDDRWDDRYDDPRYDDPRYDDRGYDDRGYDDPRFEDGTWSDPGYHDWENWDEPPRTNRTAIWGFVLAFLFCPVGLVLSAVGMRRARRRGEKGRGLAIAGLVLSLVFLSTGALVLASGVMDRLTADLRTATGSTTAPTSLPPAGPPPASVLDACTALMPTLEGAEASMTAATTEQQAAQVVVDMHTAVITAAGAPDPAFQAHLGTLATDLESLLTAFDTGQVPTGLEQTMEQDSFLVGKDCGLAGWTQ